MNADLSRADLTEADLSSSIISNLEDYINLKINDILNLIM